MNKVETMAEGLFDLTATSLLDEKQKNILFHKLKTRINKEGIFHVRSQASRSQLENKERVVEKMNALVNEALTPPKYRKPTKPTKAAREKRIKEKKQLADKKRDRQWRGG